MRDIIWTIIIIWLVYKVVDIFKANTKKSFAGNASNQSNQAQQTQSHEGFASKKDVKDVIQKSADKEGDYVDFEEIK